MKTTCCYPDCGSWLRTWHLGMRLNSWRWPKKPFCAKGFLHLWKILKANCIPDRLSSKLLQDLLMWQTFTRQNDNLMAVLWLDVFNFCYFMLVQMPSFARGVGTAILAFAGCRIGFWCTQKYWTDNMHMFKPDRWETRNVGDAAFANKTSFQTYSVFE